MDRMIEHLRAVVDEHLGPGAVPGLVMAVDRGGEVRVDARGYATLDGGEPMVADTVVRMSSMTKPVAAAAALMLVEDGVLELDAPVDRWLPELADRRVLTHLEGPVDDTVPATRPIVVKDLLTMRMGFGFVVDGPCPVLEHAAAAGLGIGPPDPTVPLTPDEWTARFARLPLMHHPGQDWMYDLSFGVLGVLLARASDMPLGLLLDERVFAPLGMADTGFAVPAHARDRLVPCYAHHGDGGLVEFDPAGDSRWHADPAFPDARGGLVSTAADYLRFARMLLNGGAYGATRLLTEGSVTAMTTDRLGPERARSTSAATFLRGAGWGYGVEVVTPGHDHPAALRTTRYGWGGGLGTVWYSFPARDTTAVLLTQVFTPPAPLIDAFWTALQREIDA